MAKRAATISLIGPGGGPSRWVALAFAVVFAVGTLAAALVGAGYHAMAVLAFLFIACFNVSFGRPPMTAGIAAIVAGMPRRSRDGARSAPFT